MRSSRSLAIVGLTLGLVSSSGCDDSRMDRDGPLSWRAPLWSGAAVTASASAASPLDGAPPPSDDWIRRDAAALFAACPWNEERGFPDECAALDNLTAALEKRRPAPQTFLAYLRSKDVKDRALSGQLWDALEPDAQHQAYLALLDAARAERSPRLAKRRALDAATLPPSSKTPGLQAKVEGFAKAAPKPQRALFLSFLSGDPSDMAWLEPLLLTAVADPDPALRLAGLRGLSSLPAAAGQAKACSAWQAALKDPDVSPRQYAQRALVGAVDFTIEDEQGLLAGRANPMRKPCDDAQIGAALVSARADLEAKRSSDIDQAVFFAAALRTRKPEVESPSVDVLRRLAEDGKADLGARVIATRALRLHPGSAALVKKLAKDKNPRVAAAAKGD